MQTPNLLNPESEERERERDGDSETGDMKDEGCIPANRDSDGPRPWPSWSSVI